jgi:hypothetical protein
VPQQLAQHFALRSDDSVEVGILGGDIGVRRAGWLARTLRESCPRWLQEVLLVAEQGLPMALATADTRRTSARISPCVARGTIPT